MDLFDEYPRPWVLHADGTDAYTIRAADGALVMEVPDFMGDGAVVCLTTEQAQELCALVNRDGSE